MILLEDCIKALREQAGLERSIPIEVRFITADETLANDLTQLLRFPDFRNGNRIVHSSRSNAHSDGSKLTFQVGEQKATLILTEYDQRASGRSGPIAI